MTCVPNRRRVVVSVGVEVRATAARMSQPAVTPRHCVVAVVALLVVLGSADVAHAAGPGAAAQDDAGVLADFELGTFRVDSASPQGKRLAIGLEIGWPTAATAKLMLRPQQAVRASVGAFTGLVLSEPSFSLNVDWLYHPFTLARATGWSLHTHVGVGGAVVVLPAPGQQTTIPSALYYRGPTQVWTGLRLPIGLDLTFADIPVDVVFDVVPTVLAFPGVGVGFGTSLGARWWW
jgi:hypothetical protein